MLEKILYIESNFKGEYMKRKSKKSVVIIIVGLFMVLLFYIGLQVSNMTMCKINVTYNGEKIKNADQIKLKVVHDSKEAKRLWGKRQKDEVVLIHTAEGLAENLYTVKIPSNILENNSPTIRCETAYYNTKEFDCAVLFWNIDIIEKKGEWLINSKVKCRHLLDEETSKRTFKLGKEKTNYVM